MIPPRAIRLVAISLILLCTAGCDQVTKHLARRHLSQAAPPSLSSHFIVFTLAENPGAFLSLGASLPPVARTLLTVAVSIGLAFLLAYLVRTPRLDWLTFLGLTFIWAGGVSNLIDRMARHGLVTDFMMIRAGPIHTGVFNLADFIIVVGMLLIVASLRASSHKREAHRADQEVRE
ncbi:MAG: signal peptidase II [Verrucomicrobia bacterium]|nr:signal peptidase II [Verrucomicrobiota bacterium]